MSAVWKVESETLEYNASFLFKFFQSVQTRDKIRDAKEK